MAGGAEPLLSLSELLTALEPVCDGKEYVFVQVSESDAYRWPAIVTVRELEGTTLILERQVAQRERLQFEGVFHRITLSVHSSLQAVGLTAVVTTALARIGCPANVVAGAVHDHVFVPVSRSSEALEVLRCLSNQDGPDVSRNEVRPEGRRVARIPHPRNRLQ